MRLQSFLLAVLLVITATTTTTHAKTVVFYPPPVTSYFIYHTNIAGELARLGHDVWLCVPHFLMEKNLVKDKSVKILEYGENLGDVIGDMMRSTNVMGKFWAKETMHELLALYVFSEQFNQFSPKLLSDKSFIDKIKGLKPDLIVLDSIPFNMNMIVLPYMLDIPFAFIGTIHDIVLSKVPFSPDAPIFFGDKFSDRMSFFQRVQSFLYYVVRINFDIFYDSSLVSRFVPHKPYKSINELASKAEIFIVEIDHLLDYPRVTLPNTKLVGGSSASPAKPLVGEFKKFVEESKNDIIVMTFGGTVVDLPPYITDKFISAFKQLNLRVVWKVNITSPDPSQILTSKWIPQNDLLGHEKTKLFISHCGKNGQYEALYHGVPVLCLPIFGDQGYNSERIFVKQLGLRADMRKASADELASMIKQIVYEPKYSENMKKASRLYRELYKAPQKEAAFWLDHVMKFGGSYMRSWGQEMPLYQLYSLDVLAFIIIIITIILGFIYLLVKQCCKLCRGLSKNKKAKKE